MKALLNASADSEALKFQGLSPLAKEWTAIFADVYAYKATLKDPSTLADDVLEYWLEKAQPKFIKAFEKHTGIVIKNMVNSTGPQGMFACLFRMGEGNKGIMRRMVAEGRFAGKGVVNETLVKAFLGAKLDEKDLAKVTEGLHACLDQDNIRMSPSNKSFDYKKYINVEFYFDPYMSFLIKDTINAKIDDLLPAEIAAIMIHEAGHVISVIEHAADNVRRTMALDKTSELLRQTQNPNIIRRELERMKKLKADTKVGAPDVKKGNEVANKMTETLEAVRKEPNIWVSIPINTAIAVITVMLVCYNLLCGAVNHIFSEAWMGEFQKSSTVSYGDKISDYMNNRSSGSLCERYADEFVSLHGLGSYVSSGLPKIILAFQTMQMGSYAGIPLQSSTLARYSASYYTASGIALMGWLCGSEESSMTYESNTHRFMRLHQNNVKAFKQDMHPDLLAFYLEENDRLVAYMKKNQGGWIQKSAILTNKLVKGVFIYKVAFVNILLTGRMGQKYTQLMNDIEVLNASSMWVQTSRLKSFVTRK